MKIIPMIVRNSKIRLLIPAVLLSILCSANYNTDNKLKEIQVTTTKTTNLIFEYGILSIDRGSDALLAQRANRIENVLQLKAGSVHLEPTNLTVITRDGKLHCFLVNYEPNPNRLVYHINTQHTWLAQFENGYYNQEKLQRKIKMSLAKLNCITLKKQHRMGITFSLEAIYSSEQLLWYRFAIRNDSSVSYTMENIRFFIEDRKKIKRTTFQQIELFPVHSYSELHTIPPMAMIQNIQVLPLQILPKAKQLSVQLIEANGSRPLELKIKNKLLIKAQPLLNN